MSNIRIYSADQEADSLSKKISRANKDLFCSFFLMKSLLVRDLKAKYRQTLLGFVGALWPTIMSTSVFVFLNSSQVLSVDTGEVPYILYAFTGSIFWTFFIEAINVPVIEFASNSSMLTRLDFPREAIILKGAINTLINLLIKLICWFFLLVYYKSSFNSSMFMLIVPILNLLLIGVSIGLFFLPVMMIYKDLQQMFTSGMGLVMYMTPVMYPVSELGYFSKIAEKNPLTDVFNLIRESIFESSYTVLEYNVWFFLISISFLLVGWIIFRVSAPFLIERMQA